MKHPQCIQLSLPLRADPPSLESRFWRKVDRRGPDECWEWTAYRKHGGYGMLSSGVRGHALLAHRVSWVLHHGSIPPGMHVLHRCDNPPCVNPDHLFLGSNSDNIADRMAKGRSRVAHGRPDRQGLPAFTEEEMAEVRERYAAGGASLRTLATEYGVSISTISTIVKRAQMGMTSLIRRGEQLPQARLTDATVRTIRARVAAGERQQAVAEDYGVRHQSISKIVRRERWKHVKD